MSRHVLRARARTAGRTLRLGALLVVLSAAFAMVFAAGALAAGAPVNVGTPFEVGQTAVAVDNAGNAIVVWNNDKDLAGATNVVQYCVIAVTANACTYSGTLKPADSAQYIDNVQVLNDSGTLVILADVYGASTGTYEPEQEWQSTDDGATFNPVDGGKSVSSGIINADTGPLNAMIVPGTNALGYGWETASGSPTFNAFPLTSPPVCSVTSCAAGYATLEPSSNPDTIGNGGGQFASKELGPTPGVLGVFFTDNTNGPFACSSASTVPFGFAFAYGSGAQSATNNYNKSPGTAGSAWRLPATQGDCNVEYQAVDGGPSGFGVLEDNELTGQTVYHRFDQTAESFATTPMVTVAGHGALDPAVSQDGSGGVYATYLNGGGGGPVALSYSYDGGTTWSGPNTLDADSDSGINLLTSSVNGAGQGWAVWADNGSVYAQSFTAADSVSPPTPTTTTTSQTAGTTTGSSISVPAGTVGETDKATITGTNASSASGTMTYALFSSSSCSAASKVFSSTVAVTGGVASASAPVTTALTTGKYYWEAAYSGNAGSVFGAVGNQASSSSCGSEVLGIGEPVAISGTGTESGGTFTLSISCAVVPCTVTVTITIDPPATSAVAARKRRKPKIITLAKGTVRLKTKGSHKVKIHASHKGKRYLSHHHGRIKAQVLLTQKIDGHSEKVSRTVSIKIEKSHKHK